MGADVIALTNTQDDLDTLKEEVGCWVVEIRVRRNKHDLMACVLVLGWCVREAGWVGRWGGTVGVSGLEKRAERLGLWRHDVQTRSGSNQASQLTATPPPEPRRSRSCHQ